MHRLLVTGMNRWKDIIEDVLRAHRDRRHAMEDADGGREVLMMVMMMIMMKKMMKKKEDAARRGAGGYAGRGAGGRAGAAAAAAGVSLLSGKDGQQWYCSRGGMGNGRCGKDGNTPMRLDARQRALKLVKTASHMTRTSW